MLTGKRVLQGRESQSESITPQDLFANCEKREKLIEAIPYRTRVHDLAKHLLFLQPVFRPEPIGDYGPFEREMYQNRVPFDFSMAPPAHLKVSDREWRYQRLVEELKMLDRDLRWLLVSRWLKQEHVAEPDQFLPKEILARLVRRFATKLSWSPEVLHHVALMTCWLPYFERLLADRNMVPKSNQPEGKSLRDLGYDALAIACSLVKKSPVQATADWIETRTDIDSRTLQNDFSKAQKTDRT